MRPLRERAEVADLAARGTSATAIAARTGVPRSTVRDWLKMPDPIRSADCWSSDILSPSDRAVYAYLLGLYLGDGYIAKAPRCWCLRVYLDAGYPEIVDSAATAVARIAPRGRASRYESVSRGAMVVVYSYSRQWPSIFPQHGTGRKHERRIELAPWQRAIADEHPRPLLRGLIHSDGCRSLNTVNARGRTYIYPRYLFSNRSEDILGIFTDFCDQLGIRWTRMNRSAISVARRDDVQVMDGFIGPKR